MLVLDVDGVLTMAACTSGRAGGAQAVPRPRRPGIQQSRGRDRGCGDLRTQVKDVDIRCRELGVEHVHQGAKDKLAVLDKLCARLQIESSACACVGDDLPDIPLMQRSRSRLPWRMPPEARHAAHLVTKLPGGHGAVREVCDYLLTHSGLTHPGQGPRPTRSGHKARGR